MTTALLTQPTKQKSKRIQIAFASSPAFQSRIESLSSKYYGMTVPEIFKMAIIKLDKDEEEDETDYIRKDKVLYATLLRHKAEGFAIDPKKDKIFKTLKDFQDATNQF
jgi:hypothetical protein